MSTSDSLNWEIYPAFKDVQTDSRITIIIGVKGEPLEIIPKLFEKCKVEFTNSEIEESEYSKKIIIKNSTDIAIASTHYNCITVRFYEKSKKLEEILGTMFHDESYFFAEVHHGEETIRFQNSRLSTISKAGYADHLGENELVTFLKFFHDNVHVADMIIGYTASEMGVCSVTIWMFEVFSEFQGKGFGKEIISKMECRAYDQGFLKMRIENTQSMGFWKKLEYFIDIDEGEKDINPFECDDDD